MGKGVLRMGSQSMYYVLGSGWDEKILKNVAVFTVYPSKCKARLFWLLNQCKTPQILVFSIHSLASVS